MSPTRYDLHGTRVADLDWVASAVARALGVEFEARESSYIGEYFRALRSDGVEVLVQENLEDEDGEVIEPDFPDYRTLVYVNDAVPDVGSRLALVTGLELLRSKEV